MRNPLTLLNIEVYGGCNYTCQVCPQSQELGGRESNFKRKMPFDVFAKIVEEARAHGAKAVSLHGSGEPTLHPELVAMVRFIAERGMTPTFFTNGERLTGAYFERLIDAGLVVATVSIIGATREKYRKAMNKDAFDTVMNNLRACAEVVRKHPGNGIFQTRHLILNPEHKDDEVLLYRSNIINPLDCEGEIWMPHNWAGQYATSYDRFAHGPRKLRSCGRPFAQTLEVRAGGLERHHGAVVPCPFVLGQDSQAVLGHLDTQSIDEVLEGEPMETLRAAHREGRFDDIPYCKGCDMLVDDTEVLVWSNVSGGRRVGKSLTSEVDYRAAGLEATK